MGGPAIKWQGAWACVEAKTKAKYTQNSTGWWNQTLAFSFLTRPALAELYILGFLGFFYHSGQSSIFLVTNKPTFCKAQATHLEAVERWKCAEVFWPLTVSVTSVSPTPIRGTMALHTYWPASAWLTDFRYSWLLLLRTCGGVEKKYTNINKARVLNSRRG